MLITLSSFMRIKYYKIRLKIFDFFSANFWVLEIDTKCYLVARRREAKMKFTKIDNVTSPTCQDFRRCSLVFRYLRNISIECNSFLNVEECRSLISNSLQALVLVNPKLLLQSLYITLKWHLNSGCDLPTKKLLEM